MLIPGPTFTSCSVNYPDLYNTLWSRLCDLYKCMERIYWAQGLRTRQSESCPQACDKGVSDHTGHPDNDNYFPHHSDITNGRNIDFLGGDFDSANGREGILTNKHFLHQRLRGGGRTHFDRYITALTLTVVTLEMDDQNKSKYEKKWMSNLFRTW